MQAEIIHDSEEMRRGIDAMSLLIHPSHWMRIREVCRHWRDVADTHSALWTTITMHFQRKGVAGNNPELVALFLRNSRQSPLSVYMDFKFDPHPVFARVLTHIPRIRDLVLMLPNPPEEHMLQVLAQGGAPMLQSLHLKFQLPRVPGWDDGDAFWFFPTIFQDDMPNLRSLEIYQISSAAPSNFRNLTQLRLSSVVVYNHCAGVIHLLYNSSSTLEDFGLYTVHDRVLGQFEPPNYTAPTYDQRFPLPKLRKLVFDTVDEQTVADILGAIDFSAHVFLFIYWNLGSKTQRHAQIPDLIFNINEIGGLGHLLADITKVQIYVRKNAKGAYASGDTFAFHARQTFATLEERGPLFPPFPRIDMTTHKSEEMWLDAPQVAGIHPNERARFFVQASNAVKLYCALGAEQWLNILRRIERREVPGTNIPVPCPLLREMHLLDPRDVIFSSDFLSELLDWLTARQEHDRPLQALYIYRIEGLGPLPKAMGHMDGDDDPQVPSAEDWEEWRTEVMETLEGLTVKVEFVDLESAMRPRMHAPAHCKVQSGSGIWKWPTWDAVY